MMAQVRLLTGEIPRQLAVMNFSLIHITALALLFKGLSSTGDRNRDV